MKTKPNLKKRKNTKVIGRIDPDAVYTSEGCMRFAGIGRIELAEARQAGVVRPVHTGRRAYYRGSELIEWVLSGGGKSSRD